MLRVWCLALVACLLMKEARAEKDYYTVLGLSKGATLKEIKKAFRSLALKYHPDKSKDPNAINKFREVAEAYEVLRDPVRRRQYEDMGHNSFYSNTGYRPTRDYKDLFKDFEDLFKEFGHLEDFFKQHFANHKIQTEAHGGNFDFGADIDFGELYKGAGKGGNLHEHMHTHGAEILKNVQGTDKDGKKCKTVTKREGNSVSTYTQCESSTRTGDGGGIADTLKAQAHIEL